MNNLHVQKTPFTEERNSQELGAFVGFFTTFLDENFNVGGSLEFIREQGGETELRALVHNWREKFEKKSIEKQKFYIRKFYETVFGLRVTKDDIQTFRVREEEDTEFFFIPPYLKAEVVIQKTEYFFRKEFFSFSIPEDIREVCFGRSGYSTGYTFAHYAEMLPDADHVGKSFKRFSVEKKNKYMTAFEMMLWLAFRHWLHGKPKESMGTTITATPIGKNKVVAVTYEEPSYVFKAIEQVRPMKKKGITDVGPRLILLRH